MSETPAAEDDQDPWTPLCVYCNAPWTPAMNLILNYASAGCDTCGGGATADVRVEISCDQCGRLVYVKTGTAS